ncbi:GTP 3',8-cyclase MoaA [Aquibacillus koreensis]|uniref:GTP 3',8-cyclase n=1 Tax=Aquibacillus koreensis TaxID=279446 RepID=A0A9X3WII2_9BACI|nr:GTP 3',8-cyclase MoaA [Aquibacillus koreensis]MCT2535894.1 GTP 3',8-cyclase MoaA [Aquibacillus koreensis]MDC3420350.1 GTP 3',8-cyclase MoaA [Aquibacillus koreensis]
MTNTPIQDKFGRELHDLRISVTDRCNFRCTYCMPRDVFGKDFAFMPKEHLLTFEEIERVAKVFVKLGVKKIRLTGGEPLLRKDIDLLIQKLVAIEPLEDIGLTTNGALLEKKAESLKKAGLQRVNVSLDALEDDLFKSINDSGVGTERILSGIKKAQEVGLEVKVNMVVKKGLNDSQVVPMAKYFKEQGITLRFIEFMDVGQHNGWDFTKVVTKKELYQQLVEHFELEPVDPAYVGEVAKRYRYAGTNAEVGFITSVSESFCSTCTRARIAADGKFYTCLFASDGLDLKQVLRSNVSDETLKEAIVPTWKKRGDRYSDERTEETARSRKKIEMSYIGG